MLNLAATTQVRVYADAYQVALGCTVTGEHDLHQHRSAEGGLGVVVAAWYS